jgi:hypothetical protein
MMKLQESYRCVVVCVIECPYCGHEDYYTPYGKEDFEIGAMVRICENSKCRREFEVKTKSCAFKKKFNNRKAVNNAKTNQERTH